MPSFLEKLKKGMGIEEIKIEKEEREEKIIKETPSAQVKTKTKEIQLKKEEPSLPGVRPPELKKTEEKELKEKKEISKKEESWLEPEGQLVVDIFQTETDLFIQSPIAGIKAEDLDIQIEGDLITIRGERQKPFQEKADYFTQECYWGKFSRQIILPVEVDPNRIEAALKEGILTIKIPKLLKEKKRKIIPKE